MPTRRATSDPVCLPQNVDVVGALVGEREDELEPLHELDVAVARPAVRA